MLSAMKREIVKVVCEAVDITDPRTIAAIAGLTDTKFVFDPIDGDLATEGKITAIQSGMANGEPFKLTAILEGKIADELKSLALGLAGRTTSGAEPLPVIEKPAGDAFLNESA